MSQMVNNTVIDETSVTGNETSKSFVLKKNRRMSVQCIWTSTLVGTLTLECSNDGGTSWSQIAAADTDLSTISPDGTAGDEMMGFSEVPGSLHRIVFTFTSGTGDLTVIITAD